MGNSELLAWLIVTVFVSIAIVAWIKIRMGRGDYNEEVSYGESLQELRTSFKRGVNDEYCLAHLYMMKLKFQNDDHQKEIDDLIEIFTR